MAVTSWEDTVQAWVKRGVPRHVAEGIADAVNDESGFHATIVNPTSGATGLYQDLGPRKSKLQSLPDWQKPEVQHDFAYSEVTGGDRIATAHWPEILASDSRAEARKNWKRYFERPTITQSDRPGGRFASSGIAFEQDRKNTSVRYMDPTDYLDLLPAIDDDAETGGKSKRRALMKSLEAGDEIEAIPTIELSGTGDKRKIVDYDGRHRAQAAADAGLTMIPVAFRGISEEAPPKEIVTRGGSSVPFDFTQVPRILGGIAGELFGIKSAAAAERPPSTAPWLGVTGPRQPASPVTPNQAETTPPPIERAMTPPERAPLPQRVPPEQASAQLPPREGAPQMAQAAPQPVPRDAGVAPWLGVTRKLPAAPAAAPSAVPPASQPPGFLERQVERTKELAEAPAYLAAGAARIPVGAAQAIAHGAEALGVPGAATAAGATDVAARGLESFIERGPQEAPYLAGAGDIGASLALPVGRVARAAGQLPRLARSVVDAIAGGVTSAAQPVTGPDYGEEKAGQIGAGLLAGPAAGLAGQLLGGLGRFVNRAVTPTDVTRAAGRLFGANADELTPEVIKKQKDRIGATMNTLEKSAMVSVRPKDLLSLNQVLSDASTLHPKEFYPIRTMVRATTSKAPQVRGDEMADLMREGTPLDRMTNHSDSNIARYANDIQRTIRNMISAALPPAARDVYSAARTEYRDMKLVSAAMEIGRHTLDPRTYASEIARRFPKHAETPEAASPEVLKLGRAVNQLWGDGNAGLLPAAAGMAGFVAGHSAMGPLGGAGGFMAGHTAAHLARDRLIELRFARTQNALAALQPPQRRFGNLLTGLGAPQVAPAAATAVTMP